MTQIRLNNLQTEDWNGAMVTPNRWHRLQQLIQYVSVHVPFYRTLFEEHGIQWEAIQTPEDFRRIPLLTKQILQQQWNLFLSNEYDIDRLYIHYTSGSTGTPLKLAKTDMERVIAGRYLMEARFRAGLRRPFQRADFGSSIAFVLGMDSPARVVKRGGHDVLRLLSLDASPDALTQHIQALDKFQPTWIYSLPSTLDHLAQFILSQSRPINLSRLQLIELAGEYLTPDSRERIRTAFRHAPVNQYSCQEIWGIAFECPEQRMHILHEHAYVEVLTEAGRPAMSGEVGEVVITSYNFRAMPLIRYRIGDLVIPIGGQCPCGSEQPVIKMIGGRRADYIYGLPGIVGNLLFDSIIKVLQEQFVVQFHRYRIVQRSEDLFDVFIETHVPWEEEARKFFADCACVAMRSSKTFNFIFCDALPEHKSEKLRSFIVDVEASAPPSLF